MVKLLFSQIMPHDQASGNARLFIEMGLVIMGLAVVARMANRLGFSGIPLYLLAGLAFGNGGIAPLPLTESFLRIGAEIGVLLLLFMLGLEYTGEVISSMGGFRMVFTKSPGADGQSFASQCFCICGCVPRGRRPNVFIA